MKRLFGPWRQYLLKEGSFADLALPFSAQAKMNKEIQRIEIEMTGDEHTSAWNKLKQELRETKEAAALAAKYFTEGLSAVEKTILWEQIKDVARGTTLAALFAVPGGIVLLPIALKMTKGALLPSAFKPEETNLKEIGATGLTFSKNIPGAVLPDDDEEAQEREELKKLKEKGSPRRIRLNLKSKKTGECG